MSFNSFLEKTIKNNPDLKEEYEKINCYLDPSWEQIKLFEFSEKPLSKILNIVDYERTKGDKLIFPSCDKVLAAFNKTPFDEIKVVILGQDPYHEIGQANGLAFSVDKGISLPPSLKNIFKELREDIGGELRTNGDLSDWAEQGVLLLNSSLTVFEHEPNSMKELWEAFTNDVISLINTREKPVIFVLWGNEAQKKRVLITNTNHFVIGAAHPSPFSAYRGFFGSKPFSKINELLKNNGQNEILWNNYF